MCAKAPYGSKEVSTLSPPYAVGLNTSWWRLRRSEVPCTVTYLEWVWFKCRRCMCGHDKARYDPVMTRHSYKVSVLIALTGQHDNACSRGKNYSTRKHSDSNDERKTFIDTLFSSQLHLLSSCRWDTTSLSLDNAASIRDSTYASTRSTQ